MSNLNEKIHILTCQNILKEKISEKFSKIELDIQKELTIKETVDCRRIYDFPNMNTQHYYEDDERICEHLNGSAILFYKSSDRIFFFLHDIKHIDAIAVVITICIYLWLSYQKVLWIHASSFCYKGHSILVLGNSGSGKSSLALAAYFHGADIISEENTCINFNDSSSIIAINRHDISVSDANVGRYPLRIQEGAYKSWYSKENKTMLNSSHFSYVKDACSPSILILLSDEKENDSFFHCVNKFQAIHMIIKLHACFNNYKSENWINLVINLAADLPVYEIIPSFEVEKTFSVIDIIIRKEIEND